MVGNLLGHDDDGPTASPRNPSYDISSTTEFGHRLAPVLVPSILYFVQNLFLSSELARCSCPRTTEVAHTLAPVLAPSIPYYVQKLFLSSDLARCSCPSTTKVAHTLAPVLAPSIPYFS
jgi:hypothetical protein